MQQCSAVRDTLIHGPALVYYAQSVKPGRGGAGVYWKRGGGGFRGVGRQPSVNTEESSRAGGARPLGHGESLRQMWSPAPPPPKTGMYAAPAPPNVTEPGVPGVDGGRTTKCAPPPPLGVLPHQADRHPGGTSRTTRNRGLVLELGWQEDATSCCCPLTLGVMCLCLAGVLCYHPP